MIRRHKQNLERFTPRPPSRTDSTFFALRYPETFLTALTTRGYFCQSKLGGTRKKEKNGVSKTREKQRLTATWLQNGSAARGTRAFSRNKTQADGAFCQGHHTFQPFPSRNRRRGQSKYHNTS